jgi:APA family basic amino acid/polyamine antiporter
VNQIGLPWFAALVKIGAICGLSSVMLVLLYGQTRIFYTMSRDGLLPSPLAVVHRRFKTPWINTIIVGVAASCAAGLLSLDALSDLANVGSLTAFALVCLTVLYLRWKDPDLHRPFRTPLFPVVPILGAVMCAVLVMSLMATPTTRHFFLVYLAGGILVYFAFGMWNSKLAKGELVVGHEPSPYELPE